ncbi:MAG TPA: tetratricopeptide repeat protein, partial [Candidatus Goldiibacteriota bacterium]|nr:tetratricopeptide repeat protein [Candidatus Goldiibacteriota bacterium]
YNNIKEYDKAIDICAKGIKQNDGFAEVYNNMAIAYYYKGNKQKAIELLTKSLSLNPDSVMARQNLEIIKKDTGGR